MTVTAIPRVHRKIASEQIVTTTEAGHKDQAEDGDSKEELQHAHLKQGSRARHDAVGTGIAPRNR